MFEDIAMHYKLCKCATIKDYGEDENFWNGGVFGDHSKVENNLANILSQVHFSYCRKMAAKHMNNPLHRLWPGQSTWRYTAALPHHLHHRHQHNGADWANIEESHWEVNAFQEPSNQSHTWKMAQLSLEHANDLKCKSWCLTLEICKLQPARKYLQKLPRLLCSTGSPPHGLNHWNRYALANGDLANLRRSHR